MLSEALLPLPVPGFPKGISRLPKTGLAVLLATVAIVGSSRAQSTRIYYLEESGGGWSSLGWRVARAGDVNQDGFDDVLVGRPTASVNGPSSGTVELRSGRDGSLIYARHGDQPWDMLGIGIAGGGDVDADGHLDFAAGAIEYNHTSGNSSGLGYVRIYSGRTGNVLREFGGPPENGLVESSFGRDIAMDGDADGDGHADVLMGAYGWEFDDGQVQLCSGATGWSLSFFNGNAYDRMGMAVAFVPDLDGDGKDEVLLGAPGGCLDRGYAVLWDPLTGHILNRIEGLGISDGFGSNTGAVGDVNGDGVVDYGITAYEYDGCQPAGAGPGPGYLRVYSGADNSLVHHVSGTQIVTIKPFHDMSPMGDIDGDGYDDFLFGNSGPQNTAGVHSGRTGAILYSFEGLTPLAFAAAGLGDANGDGFQDVAVTVPGRVDVYTLSRQIEPLCFGDGYGAPCPCGNDAHPGASTGCRNSGGFGAGLAAGGAANASADTLSLHVFDVPAASVVLYYQGSNTVHGGAGAAFGDGLRCVGGAFVRLGVRTASNVGTSVLGPTYGSQPVSNLGNVGSTGGLRVYQAHYRDGATFCTSSSFNMSNAVRVIWIP